MGSFYSMKNNYMFSYGRVCSFAQTSFDSLENNKQVISVKVGG